MNHTPLIIYHKADYDGIFCREIARQFLGDAITYTGWDYGDKVPLMAPDLEQLYMLDISIPELMDHPRLIWIDHHKSAIEKYLPKVIPGYRIDGVAACRLAWQWFSHELHAGNVGDMGLLPDKDDFVKRVVDEPLSVRLAGEYDIWDHSKSNYADVAFQFGLDCQSEIFTQNQTSMNLQTELHKIALELRKTHQTTDLAILEQAVIAGAVLVLSEAILKVRATTDELIETRWKVNRPQ